MWKRWLEEGGKLPNDYLLRQLGGALKYEWRVNAQGQQVLLMESKRAFKKRMSADPQNPAGGPSPERTCSRVRRRPLPSHRGAPILQV